MADQATRLLEGQRPVPTGNVLQTQPTQFHYSPSAISAQSHESSRSKRGTAALLAFVGTELAGAALSRKLDTLATVLKGWAGPPSSFPTACGDLVDSRDQRRHLTRVCFELGAKGLAQQPLFTSNPNAGSGNK